MILAWKRGDAVAASAGGAPPALLISTSSRPNRSMAVWASTTAWPGSRTSAWTNSIPSGSEAGTVRPQTRTRAPAARNAEAMPAPMPLVPPVTTTAWPE